MCDVEGGVMRKRLSVIWEDGTRTYGDFDLENQDELTIIGGAPYDLTSFIATGATVVVNDQEMLKALHEMGIKVRPTPRQTTITFTISEQVKQKLFDLAKKKDTNVSNILAKLAEEYVKENEE